jgi:hypothetical protein
MLTTEYALFSGTFVPIDVRVRITPTSTGNSDTIETSAKIAIQNYFDPANHNMGELVQYGPIELLMLQITGVQDAELAFNRNTGLSAGDYMTTAVTAPNQTVDQVKRQAVLQLLAKDPAFFGIIDPLFSITDTATNTVTWPFSADLQLAQFEFPQINNIIVEVVSTP